MANIYILVRNKRKYHRTIHYSPRCALPDTSIYQGYGGLNKFCSMFVDIFKKLDKIISSPEVATLHQREEFNHWPHHTVVTDIEDINLDDEDRIISPLIYPEESDDEDYDPPPRQPLGPCKSLIHPTFTDPTPEPGPPIRKPTNEPTLEPKPDDSSENSAPTGGYSIGNLLSTGYIVG